MPNNLTNVVVAGLGGQGVLKATDILADVAMRAGFDVKKSEIKGMSQRGGSVTSDVRFGANVYSPMVPPGEADYLVVFDQTQVDPARHFLKSDGTLINPDVVGDEKLPNKKSLNMALLGALSAHLPLPESVWLEALRDGFPPEFFEANRQAFIIGRNAEPKARTGETVVVKSRTVPWKHPASETDFLPQSELRDVQFPRLKNMVQRAYDHVPLFRNRMDERKLKPVDLRTMADIVKLPFTVKTDLRDTYPFGLLASPMQEVVRFHASSGTTGKPIVVAYTKEDLSDWSQAMVRSFAACGVHSGDIVQNAYGYGLFTGGLGAHYGAEALGASVIPISGGNTDRQIMILKDFGVTVICCTPSYFLHIIERAAEMGVNLKELPLRIGVFGAEPWTNDMRLRIEAGSNIKAFDIYGLSEIVGPGVAMECEHQAGPHIFEDLFYPEIIDPKTLAPLPEGQEGELVLTTLCKRAMPMIRYRTRDITSLEPAQCACGRTLRRIRRIGRRSDDMLIIRGVNLFPSQIEAALLKVEGTLPHYQIIVDRQHDLDTLEVQVEVTSEVFSDTVGGLERLKKRLGQSVESITGLHPAIKLVAPRTIQRSEGKARRVIDKRVL